MTQRDENGLKQETWYLHVYSLLYDFRIPVRTEKCLVYKEIIIIIIFFFNPHIYIDEQYRLDSQS